MSDVPELTALVPDVTRLAPEAALPASRFVPGLHPHPRRDPSGSLFGLPEHAPGLPAERWADDATYLVGIDLYHGGFLWEAHEAWEACFFASRAPQHRRLLQALIQLAAAELQLHRGIGRGVRRLAGRVVEHLAAARDDLEPGERLAGLDVSTVLRAVRARFAGALSADEDPLRTGAPPVRLEPRT